MNDNIMNNKLLWIVILLGVLLVGVFVGGPVLIDRITQKVINKMQKEYSPGPYAPGFDPDRVDPKFFREGQPKTPPSNWPPQGPPPTSPPPGPVVAPSTKMPTPDEWNKQWEKYRGD
jgi:hypothetical protein